MTDRKDTQETPGFARAGGAGLALMLLAGMAAAAGACELPRQTGGHVATTLRAGELALTDGRIVRPAAISMDFGDADHAAALDTALREIAVGREITLAMGEQEADRYGRLVGMVRIADGEEASLQSRLAELGLAVARPEPGFLDCMGDILAAELSAQARRSGIWERAALRAGDVDAIRTRAGRFAVVEGTILDVGEGRRWHYLNFGPVWRHDLTVRIPRDSQAAFAQAGMDPSSLAGRRVRVRGVVFEADGPAIDLSSPAQIEMDDGRVDDSGGVAP